MLEELDIETQAAKIQFPDQPDEEQAFDAFQTLKQSPGFGESKTGVVASNSLRNYLDRRKKHGLPAFPTKNSEANHARAKTIRSLFLGEPEDILQGNDLLKFQQLSKITPDPEAFRARSSLRTYLGSIVGRPIPADKYEHIRDRYARENLNLKGPIDDKTVFSTIQNNFKENDAIAEKVNVVGKTLFENTLLGEAEDVHLIGRAGIPLSRRDLVDDSLNIVRREAREARRRLLPTVRSLVTSMSIIHGLDIQTDFVQEPTDPKMGSTKEAIFALADLPKKDRELAIFMFANAMKNTENSGSGAERAGSAMLNAARNVFDSARNFGANVFAHDDLPGVAERMEVLNQVQAALSGTISEANPAFKPGDSVLTKMLIGGAGQIPNLAAVFGGGGGLALLGGSMAGDSFIKQRSTSPEGNSSIQLATATASGVGQVALERVLTKAGAKILAGRVPGLASLFGKAGLQNKFARTAIAAPVAVAGATATEFGEEIAQDALDNTLADFANHLSGIDPKTDWGQFVKDWTSSNQMTEEVLFSILPFALIGAGAVSSYAHFKHADFLQNYEPLMKQMGFSPGKIKQIKEADPETAARVTREEFQRVQQSKQSAEAGQEAGELVTRTEPTTTSPSENDAILEAVREARVLSQDAGFPVMTQETNKFTGEEQFNFNPPNSTQQTFDTEEEAAIAYRQWQNDEQAENLDTLADAATREAIDFLTDQDQLATGTRVEFQNVEMTPETLVKQGKATFSQLKNRAEIFALQNGGAVAPNELRIMARRFSETSQRGAYRGIVEYYRGADPINVIEDLSETVFDKGLETGLYTGDELSSGIRQLEEATGNKYLAEDYEFKEGNRMPLLEALSKASVEYLLGKVDSNTFGGKLKQWLEYVVALAGSMFRHAKTLSRSTDLMKAIKEGRVDGRFVDLIADSVGLNSKETEARQQALLNEQAQAQSLDSFEEIAATLKGKLPHPDTALAADDPLAGELKRIHSSLIKTTRRKKKDGSAVMDARAANNYFQAPGTKVKLDELRREINEEGFNFETPAEMIAALEDSLLYGIQTHATNSQGVLDGSFSIDFRGLEKAPSDYEFRPVESIPEKIRSFANLKGISILTPSSETLGQLIEGIGKSAGTKIHFYSRRGGEARDGVIEENTTAFVSPDLPDVVFVDSKRGDYPMSWLLAHELIHVAQRDHSSGYKSLEEKILGLLSQKETDILTKHLANKEYEADQIPREIVPHFAGDAISGGDHFGLRHFGNASAISEEIKKFYEASEGFRPSALEEVDDSDLSQRKQSFSLSQKGVQRLEAAIVQKLNRGPEERIDYASRLIDRLHGLRTRAAKRGELSDPERMRENIREAQAIFSALPPDVRGRASFPIADIIDAKTERGRITIYERMLDSADNALESYLKTQYIEAIDKLFDLARPDKKDNKSLRTRLTPATQKAASDAYQASLIPPGEIMAKLAAADQLVTSFENDLLKLSKEDASQEAIEDAGKNLLEAEVNLQNLSTFGALAYQNSAEISQAFEELKIIYSQGREERNLLDEAKREELSAARREIKAALSGDPAQNRWATATAKDGIRDDLEAFRMGSLSFHQVMEEMFPNSPFVRRIQRQARAAERAFSQSRIDSRERFEAHLLSRWNVPRRKQRGRLAKLSKRVTVEQGSKAIQIREWNGKIREKLEPEQAEAILNGRIKPGWENDPIAMQALRDSYNDFKLARLKDQSRAKFVFFDRVKARKPGTNLKLAELEAVYLLQLAGQKQYLPALDRAGYSEKVLNQLKLWISDDARVVADFLKTEYAAEYDQLNPVYRTLFHMDLPRIQNYAPGRFENFQTGTEVTEDGQQGMVNALSAGFTKTREHHTARPRQENALALYWQHSESVQYFIAWAEVIREMNSVFRAPDVRRSMEGKHGLRVTENFYKWLDNLATDARMPEAGETIWKKWMSNLQATLSYSGLSFNVGSLFKQISAGTGAFMEMPTAQAVRGLMTTISNPSSLKHIWESDIIQQRIKQGMSPEDKQLLDAANAKPSRVLDFLQVGRLPLAYVDGLFTTISAGVAYNYHFKEAIKAGQDTPAAERHALSIMDRVVTRTAQPATTQDKSLIENNTQGFAKFLLIFKSDPRQKIALIAEATRNAPKGELARKLFWGWAVYGLLAQLATDMWHSISREDDDDDWSLDEYIAAAAIGPLAGLPLLGSGAEYMGRKILDIVGVENTAFANSTNPLDKAVGGVLQGRAFDKLTDDGKQFDGTDFLNAALGDARAWALVLGVFKSEAAIVPVALRIIKDGVGTLDNLIPDSKEEQDLEAIQPLAKAVKEERKKSRDEKKPKFKLSKVELLLRRLPSEERAEAIARLLSNRKPRDQASLLLRLEEIGLLTKKVRSLLK